MNAEQERPVILGQAHVSRALSDPRFFETMPEFSGMRVKMATMKADAINGSGCSSCRQARVAASLFNDFLSVVSVLSADGVIRLKSYLGVKRLMINRADPVTRQVQLQTL